MQKPGAHGCSQFPGFHQRDKIRGAENRCVAAGVPGRQLTVAPRQLTNPTGPEACGHPSHPCCDRAANGGYWPSHPVGPPMLLLLVGSAFCPGLRSRDHLTVSQVHFDQPFFRQSRQRPSMLIFIAPVHCPAGAPCRVHKKTPQRGLRCDGRGNSPRTQGVALARAGVGAGTLVRLALASSIVSKNAQVRVSSKPLHSPMMCALPTRA